MRRYALRNDQWDRIQDIPPGREGYVGGTAADNPLCFVEPFCSGFAPAFPGAICLSAVATGRSSISASTDGPRAAFSTGFTLQDRLPKELAFAGNTEIKAANAFIREVYLPAQNARFAMEPADPQSAFVPVSQAQRRVILCVREVGVFALDNTVAWSGRRLQIPPHPARAHFVRAKVRVHHYPDGEIAIFHGPRRLVRWFANQEDKPLPLFAGRMSPLGGRQSFGPYGHG